MKVQSQVLAILVLCVTNGESIIEWPVKNSIRLANGNSNREGRVEVYDGYEWGTVCDDQWENVDAGVVCRELGYPSIGAQSFGNAHFGEGSGPVYFDDVNCLGTEKALGNCSRQRNCEHDEDASVKCLEDTFVWFGSTKLSNNSLITLRELNESNNLNLTCVTENTMCCSESQYIGWKFPNGSNIEQNHTGQSGVYTSVQNRSIVLHVTSEVLAVLPTGIYTCNIIDLGNTSNPLYIGIFEESEGFLEINQLYYDRQKGEIVCISSRGPVEQIVWKKDDQMLFSVDRNYEYRQTINANGTYRNTLKFIHKSETDSGNYTCQVRNKQGKIVSFLDITVCEQDSIRLQHQQEYGVLQVCFEDEWFQAVIINENVFRNDSSSITAIEFQLVPSYNIITIELIGIFIPTNFMFECSNESRHNNLLNKNTVIIPAMHQNNNSIKFDILGLLENTIYQCCLTRMSSSESSVIPSITTKCKLVKTLSNTEMTASSGVTTIILGALLGTVVILTLCTTFFICLHKIIKCRGRLLRESFEVSIMRENPLYESAGEIGQNSKVKSQIYTDMFSEPERKPDDNHQYVDIGDLRKQGTLNDTAEAANPLYATLVNSFTK